MVFAGFAVLAAVLLLVLLRASVLWQVKVALTVAVLAFSFTQWHALDSYRGWPTDKSLPTNQFVSCVVIEPSEVEHQPGAIYLWLIPLREAHGAFFYRAQAGEPRAYHEPYSEDLQQACQTAQKIVGSGALAGIGGSAHGRGTHSRFHAYKLPPINPPTKGGTS